MCVFVGYAGGLSHRVTSGVVSLATDLGGNALNRLGAKVHTAVFGNQRPDVWNEKLLRGVFFDVLEL